jgi:RHS repeat-associated protein
MFTFKSAGGRLFVLCVLVASINVSHATLASSSNPLKPLANRTAVAASGGGVATPLARYGASVAYDQATSNVVLFGGTDGTNYFSDTWIWNGRTWASESPASSPAGRYGAGMAYDGTTQTVLLFGGSTVGGGSSTSSSETWAWNGSNWAKQNPTTVPPPRYFQGMVWDPASSSDVMFGGVAVGSAGGGLGDTWTWNGTNWTQQAPSAGPSSRSGPSMAYDGGRGNVVLFGGYGCCDGVGGQIYLNDTWTWSGVSWTRQTPAQSPSVRSLAGMDYYPPTGRSVLFGGEIPTGIGSEQDNGTWTWDGSNWTVLQPSNVPFPREAAPLVNDPAWGAMLMFGGLGGVIGNSPPGAHDLDETWMWNGNWLGLLGAAPATSEIQGGLNPNMLPTSCNRGNPVNCMTGEFWHTFNDLAVPGRGVALSFSRTYSSFSSAQSGPLGYGWTHGYNIYLTTDAPSGNITVHQGNGSTVTFGLTALGYQGPARVLATLIKNADGTLTLTQRDQRQLVFSGAGQLLREVDRNGYSTNLSYAAGLLSSVTDPTGRSLTFTYTNGLLSKVTDPINRSLSFQYDANNNLVQVQDVAGGLTKFSYDPTYHLMLTMTDPTKGVLTNNFGCCGGEFISSQSDPLNRVTQYSYATGQTTITSPKGNVIVEHFQNGELSSMTVGSGTAQAATWTYTYDPGTTGITSMVDPNKHTWNYAWDANGNLLSITDPLQRTTSYTYDQKNDRTSTTDSLGVTTTNAFDANGNLTSTSTPVVGTSQIATTSFQYDTNRPGDVIKITDPNGSGWQYAYDSYGNIANATDPLGDVTTYGYDGIGRVTSRVSPRGNVSGANPSMYTTTYTYDAFGDLASVADPLKSVTTYAYDGDRNLLTLTDANNHATGYVYDLDNELTQIRRPDGTTVGASYDADGNVVNQVNGLNNATTYTFDPLDRVSSGTDALGRNTSYTYDLAGNRTSMVDVLNRTTTYGYDSANQLITEAFDDGVTPNVSFTYDADGHRLTMSDGTGKTTYNYDSLGRLTQSTDGAGQVAMYGYDLRGDLTSIVYPGSQQVNRSFDNAGRVSSISDWLQHTTNFRYDADGNLTTETYPNGTTAAMSYDAADHTTAITDSTSNGKQFLALSYQRNALAQVSADSGSSYGYSLLNQVASAAISGSTTTFNYNAADDPTQVAISGSTTTTMVYDVADEVTSLTKMNGATVQGKLQYAYDAKGNRISSTDQNGVVTKFGFDQANRLVTYGASASYRYNGDGVRMSKTISGTSQGFVWDVAEGMPRLLRDGTASYITTPEGRLLEQITSKGAAYYYHQDQLGSTRVITNSKAGIVATYNYDAYGNSTGSTGTLANPFRYAGEYLDSESNLQFLRSRYYDSTSEQFMQRDPIVSISREGYAYAFDDPVNLNDPSGLIAGGVCVQGAGGATPLPRIDIQPGYSIWAQTCFVVTFSWKNGFRKGVTTTIGWAPTIQTGGVSAALQGAIQYSPTATDPCDLGKGFLSGGGSASAGPFPIVATDTAAFGYSDYSETYQSVYDLGFGIGRPGGSGQVGHSYTWVKK